MKRCVTRTLVFIGFFAVVKFGWTAFQPDSFSLEFVEEGTAQIIRFGANTILLLGGAIVAATSFTPEP